MIFLFRSLFLATVSFFVSIIPASADAGHLIGVVIANTLPREDNIGREYDVLKIIAELEVISEETELPLDLHLYIHEEFNSDILSKLEDVIVDSDDVLFFYFSGHGYRSYDKDSVKNPWPNLLIGSEDKGVDHELITEVLESKGARLFLSIVNSCNRNLRREIELVKRTKRLSDSLKPCFGVCQAPFLKKGEENAIIDPFSKGENYRKLFLDTSGVIISSSSKPGQYSFRKKDEGTVYLEAFLQSLHTHVGGAKKPDWQSIFIETVRKTTERSRGKQIPQYTLHFDSLNKFQNLDF